MDKLSFLIPLFIIVVVVIFGFWYTANQTIFHYTQPVLCAMDAKICPDGSTVGRLGPKCEFAECPNSTTQRTGLLFGKVLIGPVCPVQMTPPDPECVPKPLVTRVQIFTADGTELVKTFQSDTDGSFAMRLLPGDYTLMADGGRLYPRCLTEQVSIAASSTVRVNIVCDTGIR